jgi:uncharacterized protein
MHRLRGLHPRLPAPGYGSAFLKNNCHSERSEESVQLSPWIPVFTGITVKAMKKDVYQPRTYRHWIEDKDLVSFTVTVKETDLFIRAASNLQQKALRFVEKYRTQLERYIERNPDFLTSLTPLTASSRAPIISKEMIEAGQKTGVGPMAAVAGAIAEHVGRELLKFSPEIIVENGGDIFLKIARKRIVGIYAGDSPLTGKVGLEIHPKDTPMGICTSSGTVGHSLSFGQADAVVILAETATLADAVATAIGNRVNQLDDVNSAIAFGKDIRGLKGIVIIIGKNVGVWGDVKLCQTSV